MILEFKKIEEKSFKNNFKKEKKIHSTLSFPTDELRANSGNDSKVGKNPKVSDVKLLNPDVWEVENPEVSVLMLGNPDPSSEYSSSLIIETENKEYF